MFDIGHDARVFKSELATSHREDSIHAGVAVGSPLQILDIPQESENKIDQEELDFENCPDLLDGFKMIIK
jgi:hypothetical protein